MEKKEEKIGEALMKVALGYQLAEVTEEYAEVDGELKLTKRKKTKKDVPPDLKAVQLLLSSDGGDIAALSDDELEKEKQRLLTVLQETQKGGGEKTKPVKSVKTAKEKKSADKTVKTRAKPRKRVVKSAKA